AGDITARPRLFEIDVVCRHSPAVADRSLRRDDECVQRDADPAGGFQPLSERDHLRAEDHLSDHRGARSSLLFAVRAAVGREGGGGGPDGCQVGGSLGADVLDDRDHGRPAAALPLMGRKRCYPETALSFSWSFWSRALCWGWPVWPSTV